MMKIFFKWYTGSFIVSLFGLLVLLYVNDIEGVKISEIYQEVLLQLLKSWEFWFFLLIPYLLYLLARFYYRIYTTHGFSIFAKRVSLSLILPIGFLIILFKCSQSYLKYEDYNYEWDTSVENKTQKITDFYYADCKQRGAHVFGSIENSEQSFLPLIKNNIEWITFVPFIGQEDYDSPEIGRRFRDSVIINRMDSIWKSKIDLAHEFGFKVMLKPHIWLSTPSMGKWRSDIYPKNEENWLLWSADYRKQMMHYAALAEESKVAILCVGTELSQLALRKPKFWNSLIREIREIYSGELTYAANWDDELGKIKFWADLDYIGIQAYFPIAQNNNPERSEIIKGWQVHLNQLEEVYNQFKRPILFTEMGYKSTLDSARKPWAWSNSFSNLYKKVSTRSQANCYEVFFQIIWPQKWFAGVHIWQWRSPYERSGGKTHLGFTPQRKPAENIIAKGFGVTRNVK